jgi:hypothetical protein
MSKKVSHREDDGCRHWPAKQVLPAPGESEAVARGPQVPCACARIVDEEICTKCVREIATDSLLANFLQPPMQKTKHKIS